MPGATLISPEFEILWKKVAEAYTQVAAQHELTIKFEQGIYGVTVGYRPEQVILFEGERGTEVNAPSVIIEIHDNVAVTPPTLVSP